MVSYNHIIRKNLRLQRAANSQRLQWHQSRWFDTWKKKPTYHQWNNHEMRYSLSNGTAEVVPRSCCNRRLSHETRAMLKAKIKENEAYNTSGVCATLKQTRKDKRARCFACKERGHVHLQLGNLIIYYKLLLQGKSIFSSDQALVTMGSTKALVTKYASSKQEFENAFVKSMIKMSSINGGGQEVRHDCRVVN
ncbi:peroxidase 64-like protein [Tanacetum coccineum]